MNKRRYCFSIVVVSYNAENSIENTLKSILNQEFSDYEIVCIDGKSTDSTLSIIKKYSSLYKNITYISEKDNGIYDAMNKGIKRSNGEYIFFLNCGDEFYNENVLSTVKLNLMNNEADIIYGNSVSIVDGIEVVKCVRKINNFMFLQDKTICHQAIFAKKKVFEVNGYFNLNYKLCSDFEWLLKCYKSKLKFKYIDFNICYYDLNGVSSSEKSFNTMLEEHTKILNENYGFFINKIIMLKRYLGKLKRKYI